VPAGSSNGFVIVDPVSCAVSNSAGIMYSGALYTYDGFPLLNTTTGVLTTNNHQAPFVFGEIGPGIGGVQYRVVGCGLRVRYDGNELNRGGRIIPFRHPQNRPYAGYSSSNVLSYNEVFTLECDRKWHEVTYIPVSATDYLYTSTAPVAAPTVAPAGSIGFICTNSGAETATTFEWEAVFHYEYTGTVEDLTASHSDVPGMSAIRNFLEGGFDGKPGTNLFQEIMTGVSRLGPADISGYVTLGTKLLTM